MVTETLMKPTPPLPSRAGGKCRNRPLAAWRRARAVELATLGLSYEAIARQVGYTSRGTAHRVIHQALQERTSAAVAVLRQQELDRLNALQHALWSKAMAGDIGAVLAVEKLVMSRCRLLGLDKPQPTLSKPPAGSVVATAEELLAANPTLNTNRLPTFKTP
jgi:hypothetical protein